MSSGKQLNKPGPWDDFAKDAVEASRPRHLGCAVEKLLASLGDVGRGVVATSLANRDVTTPAIITALKARNVAAPSEYSMNRHRRGGCKCAEGDKRE